MAQRVAIYDAAIRALGRYLSNKLATVDGMGDCTIRFDWPPPDVKLDPKTIVILAAGKYEHEDVEPYVMKADPRGGVLDENTWIVAFIEQPLQIDVWATNEPTRSHMVACLMDLLFYGLGFTLGQGRNPDPIANDTQIALADGWEGIADFWFDSAGDSDSPNQVFQNEYRATFTGAAELVLTVKATSPRLATFIFKERLRQSGDPSTYTGTYDLAAQLGAQPPYSKDVP